MIGEKFDAGKLRMSLLPASALNEIEEQALIEKLDLLDRERNIVQQRLREVRNRIGRNKQSMVGWAGMHPRLDNFYYKYGEQK